MPDELHDLDARLDAALQAMQAPATVSHTSAERMAARAILASGPRARRSSWMRQAAAACAVMALGATAWTVAGRRDAPSAELAVAVAVRTPDVLVPASLSITPIASAPVRPIVFEFEAPDARSVQVLGDFNEWSRDAIALQRGSDGRWRITTLLPPGRYVYTYLVDGSRFARDPQRDAVEDRDFGVPGSELVVGEAP